MYLCSILGNRKSYSSGILMTVRHLQRYASSMSHYKMVPLSLCLIFIWPILFNEKKSHFASNGPFHEIGLEIELNFESWGHSRTNSPQHFMHCYGVLTCSQIAKKWPYLNSFAVLLNSLYTTFFTVLGIVSKKIINSGHFVAKTYQFLEYENNSFF